MVISEQHFTEHHKRNGEQHHCYQISAGREEQMKGIPTGPQMWKICRSSRCDSSRGHDGDMNRALGINLMGWLDITFTDKQLI